MPEIKAATDAIVKIAKTTICGTDLHILKGDIPTCAPGRILGHELCEDIVAPGGTIANIGVHGLKVDLHLEKLWSSNITITTRLVDTVTTPMLLKTVASKKIDPTRLITHRYALDRILDAYETFGHAAETRALKMLIEA